MIESDLCFLFLIFLFLFFPPELHWLLVANRASQIEAVYGGPAGKPCHGLWGHCGDVNDGAGSNDGRE